MGEDAERDRRLSDLAPLPGQRPSCSSTRRRSAIFLHCLPAHRGRGGDRRRDRRAAARPSGSRRRTGSRRAGAALHARDRRLDEPAADVTRRARVAAVWSRSAATRSCVAASAPDAERQRARVEAAARRTRRRSPSHRTLVVTHGNGPQVGLLALQAAAYPEVAPYPLDVLDAESEGMIGYLLELALRNALGGAPRRDPSHAGRGRRRRSGVRAARRSRSARSTTARRADAARPRARLDGRTGRRRDCRRVVASPEPRGSSSSTPIELLLAAGVIVICAGGGGIPVVAPRTARSTASRR